jgi:dienelactone hydrolase
MDKLTIGGLLFCFAAGVSAVNIPPQKASMIDRKVFEENYAAYRAHFRKNAAPRLAPDMKVEAETKLHGCILKTVSYQVEPDERIQGYLMYPADYKPGEKRPLVLCLHGTNLYGKDAPVSNMASYPAPKNEWEKQRRINRENALHLVQRGFICFAPDRAGYGVRRTAEFQKTANAVAAQGAYVKEHVRNHPGWDYRRGKVIHDLQQALDFLVTLPEVDAENIGSIGHSLGGNDTAELAAADKRIKAAVVSCGGGIFADPKLWTRADALAAAVKKPLPMDKERNLTFQAIAPRGLLLVVGMSDPFSPQSMMKNTQLFRDYYLSQMPKKEFEKKQPFGVLLHAAGHDMPQYVRDCMYGWLELQLKSTVK